jgi:flagellar biogenesis protein FliO
VIKWSECSKALTRTIRAVVRISPRRPRYLQLRETLPLGEHRLLAVIAFREHEFLIGASGGSMSLLTTLPASREPNASEIPEPEGGPR